MTIIIHELNISSVLKGCDGTPYSPKVKTAFRWKLDKKWVR